MGLLDFLFGSGGDSGGGSDEKGHENKGESFSSGSVYPKHQWTPLPKVDQKHGPDGKVNQDAPRPKHGIDW